MRRITFWAMSTLTALVLLFSYHTSTVGAGAVLANRASAVAPVTPGATDGSTSSGAAATDGTSGTSGTTYDGDTVQTRWGPIQVRITVQAGRIVASEAVVYPNGNHEDAQINAVALPTLGQEVVQAQSATIDMVSGATVTSDGYLQSLQSAIDRANL